MANATSQLTYALALLQRLLDCAELSQGDLEGATQDLIDEVITFIAGED